MSIQKPNCGNCSLYDDCPLSCIVISKVSQQQLIVDTVGCLIHPGAREYLNEAVILYLESVEAEFQKHFLYAEGKEYEIWGTALNRTREAILLIKGDKT